MSLITAKDLAKAVHLDKMGAFGTFIGSIILRILKFPAINKIYEKNKDLEGTAFFSSLLKDFNYSYEISDEDLKRIPKEGPFITISNHPLGGADGILLLKVLTDIRPDFKITGNFLLHKIKPIAPYVIAVNPFENRKDIKARMGGTQLALKHLEEGYALGFFPAGEVSTKKQDNIYVDREWSKGAIRIIQKAKVPVVPVYFHTKNSRWFYLFSKISGLIRTAKLPSELLNKDKKPIQIRIGKIIKTDEIASYEEVLELRSFLRKKTYLLANSYDKKKKNPLVSVKNKFQIKRKPKQIVAQKDERLLIEEIDKLRSRDKCLLTVKNYEIYFTSADNIPNVLHEIGRLREVTFRDVGEGTNKAIDLDKFDKHYHHLFLWDKEAHKLAGAYRMGLGKEIYPKYGMNGFYITTLFRFEPELHKMLSETIEMGRAFVVKAYQQKPMPLFLLWKGVIHVTLRYPEHKYLIGGVSISNQFSNFSKSLMIEFMKSNYYDPFIAQYIQPKKEYKVKLKDADRDFVFDYAQADLKKFDKFINEIEPEGLRVPVLIKKYVKQNVKLVAFNVDPKFNDAIDGLMYIRISDLPESTVKPVLEEYQAELLRKSE